MDAARRGAPVIAHPHFTGTGTRSINDERPAGDRRVVRPLVRLAAVVPRLRYPDRSVLVRTFPASGGRRRSRRQPCPESRAVAEAVLKHEPGAGDDSVVSVGSWPSGDLRAFSVTEPSSRS